MGALISLTHRRQVTVCCRQAVRDVGIASVAVVLKHAYIFGVHEEAVGDLARELGFTQVTQT